MLSLQEEKDPPILHCQKWGFNRGTAGHKFAVHIIIIIIMCFFFYSPQD
jgi:hypothetical protein